MLVRLNDHVYKWSAPKHHEWGPQLLDLIKQQIEEGKAETAGTEGASTYWYDWNIEEKSHKLYSNLFNHCVKEPINLYAQHFGSKLQKKSPPWFQQYVQNQGHGWHSHSQHIALIYYVELPDPSEATVFYNSDAPPSVFDVTEGDILMWPSFLPHSAPIIKSKTRKTIIACNIELETDREYVYEQLKQI